MEATDLGRRLALGFTGSLYRIFIKSVVLHDLLYTISHVEAWERCDLVT